MSSAVTLASTSRDEITSLAFHCVSSNSRITLPSSLVCLPARYHTVTVCSPIYGRFPIFEGWMVLSTSGGIFKPSDFRDNFYASASNSRQTALCFRVFSPPVRCPLTTIPLDAMSLSLIKGFQ